MAGLALADGVESANIVGYQQITLANQYTILGVNFTAVDGSNLSLQDAVPYVEGMTAANVNSAADQIQIQNASGGYDIYYMSNGKNAKGSTVENLEGKWAKGGTAVATTDKFPVGGAAWYVRQGTDPVSVQFVNPVAP